MNCTYSEFNLNNQCYTCPPGCKKCTNEAVCLECHSHFLDLTNSNCIKNYRNKCTYESSSKLNITSGYLNSNGNCEPCHSSCISCYGPGIDQCLQCNHLSVLYGTTCVNKASKEGEGCGVGKFPNFNNMCNPCPPNCIKCTLNSNNYTILNGYKFSEFDCNTCNEGYFLSGSKCITDCIEDEAIKSGKCAQKSIEDSQKTNTMLCSMGYGVCGSTPDSKYLEQALLAVILGITIVTVILGIIIFRNYRVLSRKMRTLRINQQLPRQKRPSSIELLDMRQLDKTQFVEIKGLDGVIQGNRAKWYKFPNIRNNNFNNMY